MPIERSARVRPVPWLHLGFALTGIGTTLLGCLLPTLSTIWHMNDDRAGILFAAQFSGSALGALFVGTNFFSSVVRGYLLLIASAVSIAWFADSRSWLSFFSFGLGLGLTMTATSMLIGSTFVARRGAALSLLNASWAIGAALCPTIASFWITRESPTRLFLGLALALGLVVTLIVIGQYGEGFSPGAQNTPKIGSNPKPFRFVLVFAALAFLYVGVEVSLSGWMMAYVHRLVLSSRLWAPLATSFFWIALVCGRTIAPGVLRIVPEAELLGASLVIAFMSVVVLLLSQTPVSIVLSAAFAGLALGPIFPLCLAAGLVAMNDSPRTKWIYAISGLGGAVLPWMTGKVSALHGSLRNGLIVPVLALSAMIILYRWGTVRWPASIQLIK
jgi:MFS transporter, FHS family, glucose/mannose:H+ symporter